MKMCSEKEIYKFHEIYDCYGHEAKEIISQFLHDFFLDQPERLNPEVLNAKEMDETIEKYSFRLGM